MLDQTTKKSPRIISCQAFPTPSSGASQVGGFMYKFFRQMALQSQEISLIMAMMQIFGSGGR